jgi:predicted ATPase
MTALDEATQIVERTGERWLEAELYRLKGLLSLQQRQTAAAENFYHQALQVASGQEAKLWELRAATSLARLCGKQGRRAEACELLTPVYNWFTEGFDITDLTEAKALLEALA